MKNNTQSATLFNEAIEAIRIAKTEENVKAIIAQIFDKSNITKYSLYHLELIKRAAALKYGYIIEEETFQRLIALKQ
jgi:hypothetical protein